MAAKTPERMAAPNPVPHLIPTEAETVGRWTCVVCGVEKPIGNHGLRRPASFPTPSGDPDRHETECRACRDDRPKSGPEKCYTPWDPRYRGPLLGWDTGDSTSPAELLSGDPPLKDMEEEEVGGLHPEGAPAFRQHLRRERNPKVRRDLVAMVRHRNDGRLSCEACGLRIEPTYGTPDGQVYECHHLVPLHITDQTTTAVKDTILLCPTCHRAAHRIVPLPTEEELRSWHHRLGN